MFESSGTVPCCAGPQAIGDLDGVVLGNVDAVPVGLAELGIAPEPITTTRPMATIQQLTNPSEPGTGMTIGIVSGDAMETAR